MDTIYKQGDSFTDSAGRTGIVNFDTKTGARLGAGQSTTINSTSLQPTKPFVLPPVSTPTSASGLEGYITQTNTGIKTDAEKLLAEQQTKKDDTGTTLKSTLDSILGTNNDIANVGNTVDRSAEDKARKEADNYTSQIEAEQLASRRAVENIIRNNPTGATRNAVAGDIANIERDSVSKQADLAILQNSALRNYETANAIADRQVKLKLEPLKAKLENLKFFYTENKADFNRADDRLYNEAIKKADAELKKEEVIQTDIKNIKIEAAKNGATSAVLNKLGQAKTLDEALKSVGGFLTSPKEKLELEKLRGDISKNTMELLAAKGTLGGTTGDPVQDIILASSRYGDKRLTDSQLEKIQKATTALGGMETLQGLLSQGKDGLSLTGPVKGRARNLISQLGGDADARAINATIQGLIPTIARGIFGEVGVLTDADINNYKKTVPNIVSTEDQNKLVSIIMYDVLSRSLKSTLTSNAQNQTNVSGFANTYTDVNNRVNKLKSELGVVESATIDPVNKAKLDTAWQTQLSPQNITNSLNSFFN